MRSYNVFSAMQKPKLFGTDGMRGVAGRYPLDPRTLGKLGNVLGLLLQEETGERTRPRVVLGEDTRESSSEISRAIAGGLQSTHSEVLYAGVITTPGIAFLTRRLGCTAGVMVSASHNPYQDNGIKIFARSGLKLSEAQELAIEAALESPGSERAPVAASRLIPEPALLDEYVQYLGAILPEKLPTKMNLVIDCGNGAASRVVPALLPRLGIQARILNGSPNGRNINQQCGALYPHGMAEETRSLAAHLGVAFDGDADRAIFATPDGQIADGDHILYAEAPFLKSRGQLKGHTVVGTLMTNLGLEIALEPFGIGLVRTAVGDKYVLDEILRSEYSLGGEPSGHIIFADLSLAGDGILTLLQALRLIAETKAPFSQLVAGLKQFPQLIRNVPVREKRPFESLPEVTRVIDTCRGEVGKNGRIIVRYSGTERLARVMVEAESLEVVERHAARIASAIELAIGAG